MHRAAEGDLPVAERYNREASAYREHWGPVLRLASVVLVRRLAEREAARIVDIGTGVGMLLPELRAAFPRAKLAGVDRAPGMLRLAPPGYPLAVMDATRLALAPASLDLVTMVFMLHHLEGELDGLREARRVLCDGGRLGTLTWGAGDIDSTAWRLWNACVEAHGAQPLVHANDKRHDPFRTAERMEARLRETGFRSGRAWEDELVCTIGPEHLVGLCTGIGAQRRQFESLSPEARAACLTEVRHRMRALAPADFVARAKVVFATATA